MSWCSGEGGCSREARCAAAAAAFFLDEEETPGMYPKVANLMTGLEKERSDAMMPLDDFSEVGGETPVSGLLVSESLRAPEVGGERPRWRGDGAGEGGVICKEGDEV